MSDIVTRLLLKTNDFDANLEKSKKSVGGFQDGISNMTKTAGAGVMKFAGALGIAVGASEGLIKTIESTQTTGDAYAKMIDQAKASVDSFFTSIALGNFDGFLSNLQNVIDKAGDLSVALDNLGTKTLFNNAEVDDLNTKYQIELNKAKARNISDEERNKHLAKAKEYLLQMAGLQQSLATSNTDASYTALQAEISKMGFGSNVSREMWDYLIKDSKRSDVEKTSSDHKSRISGYNKRIGASRVKDEYTDQVTDTDETKKIRAELKKYKESRFGLYGELNKLFLEAQDDENSVISNALKMRMKANSLKVAISAKGLEIDNTDAKINGSYNKVNGGGNTPKEEPKKDSIAWYDSQISAQNKKLIAETDTQARGAIQATINELQQQKINLKFTVDQEAFKIAHGEMKDKGLPVPIKPIYNDKVPTHGKGGKNFKLPKHEPAFNKKDIGLNQDYAESLSAIGGVMSSLSGVTNESAAAYLQWGANVVSSIAQAIPAITSLITAKQTEAVVNGVASATETPVIGWLLAGAAVASVIAAMSSIPKFATGGIVPGTSFTGDKVPALLNSGEMILNGSQQSGLFRLLNGGVSGNLKQAISPSNNIQYISAPSNVTFRIHGRDLEGVLSNYHNQKTKVR